jgi:glycerol-3-phosphate acyltransferase PlsY
MRVFTAHLPPVAAARAEGPLLLRDGFAWGACLFGGFWLLFHRLWFAALAWIVTFYASRYVSLASIVAAFVLPAAAWVLGAPTAFAILATVLGVFVILRHRANIQRLLAGTENKFVKKAAE